MANYLVSVFVGGKNVNSYYSDNLDDLITIKALHRDCEITIFDIKNFVHYTQSQVENEIAKSAKRWKQSLRNERIVSELPRPTAERTERKKVKKYWDRPVKCVETGQVFDTIRDCCDHLGLSYKSGWNAINNGRSRCGLHFVDARKCATIPTANTDKR